MVKPLTLANVPLGKMSALAATEGTALNAALAREHPKMLKAQIIVLGIRASKLFEVLLKLILICSLIGLVMI